jgi:uncharacterized membrane protein YdbT with pleckstrin-like domain
MEVFNHENLQRQSTEPVRSSVALLVVRLAFIVILFDAIYSLIFYFLNIYFHTPIEWHHHISTGMLILFVVKTIFEVGLLVYATVSWINTTYQIENGHLVIKRGIFHTYEDVYELKTIRAIEVDQSIMGKLFHFGDVILKTSASGGYQVIVTLMGIANPYKYEKTLNKYF